MFFGHPKENLWKTGGGGSTLTISLTIKYPFFTTSLNTDVRKYRKSKHWYQEILLKKAPTLKLRVRVLGVNIISGIYDTGQYWFDKVLIRISENTVIKNIWECWYGENGNKDIKISKIDTLDARP